MTADGDAIPFDGCSAQTMVAMALELGIRSGGLGHPLFKGLGNDAGGAAWDSRAAAVVSPYRIRRGEEGAPDRRA